MTKPIFVIRLNYKVSRDEISTIRKDLDKNMPELVNEYHIIFASGANNHIQFECYNPSDLPEDIREKTLEALNKIIEDNKNA